MRLGGMTGAIHGHCIDSQTMLAAMTIDEKRELIRETQTAIERWERLCKIRADAQETEPDQ